MQTKEVNPDTIEGTIEKAIETVPNDYGHIGPVIEELENDGWNFVNSNTQHGFISLYFTRFKS